MCYQFKIPTNGKSLLAKLYQQQQAPVATPPIWHCCFLPQDWRQLLHDWSLQNLANPSENVTPQSSTNPITYKTAGFGEGHLHCALPVWGLLPEENSTINKTAKSIKLPLKSVKIAPTNECSYDTTDCQMDLKGSGNGPSQRTGTDSCNMTPIWPPSHLSKGQTLGPRMQQEASKDRVQPLEHAQSSVPLWHSKKASLPIVSIKEGASKCIGQTMTGTSFRQQYYLCLCLQQK